MIIIKKIKNKDKIKNNNEQFGAQFIFPDIPVDINLDDKKELFNYAKNMELKIKYHKKWMILNLL